MTRRPLYDAVTRSMAAELYDKGHGVKSISNQIGVPYEAVRQWINTYRSVGIEGLAGMGKRSAVYSFETKVAAGKAVNKSLGGGYIGGNGDVVYVAKS